MPVPEVIAEAVSAQTSGSVIAPAGYGKTETIAEIVANTTCRCLLLTHTLAGVEALRSRLKSKGVRSERYQLDTIAAWTLRYASSFPKTSGIPSITTPRGSQWPIVYQAARQLLTSGTLDVVIRASYSMVLVDEYQDCTVSQHEIVKELSRTVPVIVFGDPLQGIYDFGAEAVVDWTVDVLPSFPQIDELKTPWRWKKLGNNDLAKWLRATRDDLLAGKAIDLQTVPSCIRVHHVKNQSLVRKLEAKACNAISPSPTNRLVIVGAKGSENQRAALAKRVRAQTVETIECKGLQTACVQIEALTGLPRLRYFVKFLSKCIVGVNPTPFLRRIEDIHKGKRITKPLSLTEAAALQIVSDDHLEPFIVLIDEFRKAGQAFRSELLFALKDSLASRLLSEHPTLLDCAWHIQERRRHTGRRHGYKIVTSTLLVKGLEYENSVVFLSHPMTKEDAYVALTRASLRIEIVTEHMKFQPL